MSALFLNSVFLLLMTVLQTFNLLGDGISILPVNSIKRNPQLPESDEGKAMNENLLSKVDFEKNPCIDFYQYACGKHNDSNSESERSDLTMTKRLIEIVKSPIEKTDYEALKITKQMFQSCLKHESNIEDLKNMINHLGGWSLLDLNWKDNNFSLSNFFLNSMEIGYFPESLFAIHVEMEAKTKKGIIVVGSVEESRSFLNSLAYFHTIFIPTLAGKMKINQKYVQLKLLEFKKMRESISKIYEQTSASKFMKLSKVEKAYGNIPLFEILNIIFKPITISKSDFISITCPICLKSLNELLRNTSKKSLANYLMGSFLSETIMDADNAIMVERLKYNGKNPKIHCTNQIFSLFRRVMDYEYKKRGYFDESLIPMVLNLTEKLKKSMENIISVSTMMDPETKLHAIDKVKEMAFKVAYDDEIDNEQKVINYFSNLKIPNPKSYLPSLLKIKKFTKEKMLEYVNKPAKLRYLEATSDHGEYFTIFNTIFLSVTYLTGVFYSKGNIPEYFNFAGLGSVIAHEMNHAFDSEGHKFNKQGHLKNWWSAESLKKYYDKIECIKNQYSNFINPETGHKVNGIQTLDENFADIGGIEVAYNAYHELCRDPEFVRRELQLHKSLKNFQKFNPSQMFWISVAGTWCMKLSKEDIEYREKTDRHAIEPVRVNSMAINTKEFAIDWKCKGNTPMNPKHKCTVWNAMITTGICRIFK